MGLFTKSALGIDIGASSVKVVELSTSLFGKKKKLSNYAKFSLPLNSRSIETFHGKSLVLLSGEVSEILKGVLKESGIKERSAAFSLPDFSTFFTTFNLPPMSKKEVPQAVEFEARHHIPLPLSEVTFDWQIVEREEVQEGVKLKILLVAVPNRVLSNYQKMINLTQIKLSGMEAEVFGLIRSSVPEELKDVPVCLMDAGWQSTSVSIVKNDALMVNHSFNVSGNDFTKAIQEAMGVSFEEAEELKKKYGMDPDQPKIVEALSPKIAFLAREIGKVCDGYFREEGEEVNHIIMAGGNSSLFGFKEYLESRLRNREVRVVDPFVNLSSPSILHPRLRDIGPSFSVAIGVAMMGLES